MWTFIGAHSGEIASEAARVELVDWRAAPKPQPRKLHALIAGVGDDAAADMPLAYAAEDAHDFAKGCFCAQVTTRVPVYRQVTRESPIERLDWLASVLEYRPIRRHRLFALNSAESIINKVGSSPGRMTSRRGEDLTLKP